MDVQSEWPGIWAFGSPSAALYLIFVFRPLCLPPAWVLRCRCRLIVSGPMCPHLGWNLEEVHDDPSPDLKEKVFLLYPVRGHQSGHLPDHHPLRAFPSSGSSDRCPARICPFNGRPPDYPPAKGCPPCQPPNLLVLRGLFFRVTTRDPGPQGSSPRSGTRNPGAYPKRLRPTFYGPPPPTLGSKLSLFSFFLGCLESDMERGAYCQSL